MAKSDASWYKPFYSSCAILGFFLPSLKLEYFTCLILFPGMSEEAIMELNLPTGIPIVYELDKNLKPVGSMQFLGDEETVKKAMEAVAAQGKAKK